MEKKEFDVQRLKRRLSYLVLVSREEEGDLFECGYCFAIKQCLRIIDDIANG